MSNAQTAINCHDDNVKRFRSVKEYREKKKLQRTTGDSLSVNGLTSSTLPERNNKEEFIKLLKDTVAAICYERLHEEEEGIRDPDFVPEWRVVCRIISDTLLDKEGRLAPDVRFNMKDSRLREATMRRIKTYTRDYLDRKYPK